MYTRKLNVNRNYGGIPYPNYNTSCIHRGNTRVGTQLLSRGEPLTVTTSRYKDVGGLRTTSFYLPAAFDPTDPKTWDRTVIFT